MAKTAPLGFRLEEATKAAIEEAARDDKRSVSQLVEIIITAWLQANGYLPAEKTRRK